MASALSAALPAAASSCLKSPNSKAARASASSMRGSSLAGGFLDLSTRELLQSASK